MKSNLKYFNMGSPPKVKNYVLRDKSQDQDEIVIKETELEGTAVN